MSRTAARGYVPEDERNFSESALPVLKDALEEVCWLLERGYPLKSITVFVGNHHLLSERQRLALARIAAAGKALKKRKKKEITDLSGKTVWIDGFNEIITLETASCGGILLLSMDGTIRDLASLRGTYRIIPETCGAAERMFSCLKKKGAAGAEVLLDEPVSNSGRLRALLLDAAEETGFPVDVQILRDVDRTLYEKENVITSDSVILDHCRSWYNLTPELVRKDACIDILGRPEG